jgi:Na+/melibiose symporter-like transporter
MIIIPMIGLLLSVLFFRRRYRLSEDTMGQIQSELKENEELREREERKEKGREERKEGDDLL